MPAGEDGLYFTPGEFYSVFSVQCSVFRLESPASRSDRSWSLPPTTVNRVASSLHAKRPYSERSLRDADNWWIRLRGGKPPPNMICRYATSDYGRPTGFAVADRLIPKTATASGKVVHVAVFARIDCESANDARPPATVLHMQQPFIPDFTPRS